jgi:hypothetical protein
MAPLRSIERTEQACSELKLKRICKDSNPRRWCLRAVSVFTSPWFFPASSIPSDCSGFSDTSNKHVTLLGSSTPKDFESVGALANTIRRAGDDASFPAAARHHS